jgi:hypothetical protein
MPESGGTPEFSRDFQYQLAAHLVKDPAFARSASGWLKPSHFSMTECALLYGALLDFVERFRDHPSAHTLGVHLAERWLPGARGVDDGDLNRLCTLFAHIHSLDKLEPEYYRSRLADFIREVEIHNLIGRTVDLPFGSRAGQVLEGVERIRSCTAGRGMIDVTSASGGDAELLMTEEECTRIPTGLRQLDVRLSGGLAPRELGMVTACTGVGKTNALINFHLSAILAGYRSLFITTELPAAKIKHRFIALSTGIDARHFKSPFPGWPREARERYGHFADKDYRYRGKDAFVDFSDRGHSIMEIEDAIGEWRNRVEKDMGKDQAALCISVDVDWLDYISSEGLGSGFDPKTHELLTEKARQLGFVARRTGTGIWTATQGTREADGREVLKLRHTSGAYHKNDALDISIGLGRENEDGTFNDLQNPCEVINEDSEEDIPCNRNLIVSVMKNRGGSGAGSASFRLFQGPSLRFWDSRNQMMTYERTATTGQYSESLTRALFRKQRG